MQSFSFDMALSADITVNAGSFGEAVAICKSAIISAHMTALHCDNRITVQVARNGGPSLYEVDGSDADDVPVTPYFGKPSLSMDNYDAIEIDAEEVDEGSGEYNQCEQSQADIFTVRLHLKTGGAELIAQFSNADEARAYAEGLAALTSFKIG